MRTGLSSGNKGFRRVEGHGRIRKGLRRYGASDRKDAGTGVRTDADRDAAALWQSQAAARRSRLPLSRCECIVYFAEADEMCSDRRELCRLCKVYAFRASRSRPLLPWRGPKRSSTAPQCHRQPSRTNTSRPRPLLFLHAHPKKQCHNARRRRGAASLRGRKPRAPLGQLQQEATL